MHVLINAASANMGGAMTYLQNLMRWLPEIAPENRYTVYLPEASRAKMKHQDARDNVRLRSFPYDNTGGLARLYFDQVEIPRTVRRQNIDVLFSSTGFGTFAAGCPEVLLVRNPVYFSKSFAEKYRELGRSLRRNTMRRWHSLASMRRADTVVFPTRAMQDMVEQYVDLQDKPTRAIHYGFDHERFWQGGDSVPSFVDDIRRWKGEGFKIVLNVSTYAVHKNFETLIRALPALIERSGKIKLLTTTSREQTSDKTEYDELKAYARRHEVERSWVELGYVPYENLHVLYQMADLFAFPSFTESFGHSLVEAMAAELPIVAADMPVNREVCGEAARYFGMFDAEDCAEMMYNVLQDEAVRSGASAASADRARHFSWRKYAEELLEVFHECDTSRLAYAAE